MATQLPRTSDANPATRAVEPPPVQRLFGVTYGAYVRIRDDRRNDGLRLTFYDGVLEIMSPEYLHERGGEGLTLIVRVVADVFDVEYMSAGSTTFRRGQRRRPKGKGKEPDRSFYFAREPSVRTKETLDLESDPPPDLWIEVDNRGSSKGRLPVYAEFGVPEVWQYRAQTHRLRFLRLIDAAAGYMKIDRSLSLPMLSPELVLAAMSQGRGLSDLRWSRWLRGWAAQLPNP